jgi:hypothetical protein
MEIEGEWKVMTALWCCCPDEISYKNCIADCERRGFKIISSNLESLGVAIDDPEGKY